jgi:hypothetical protein
MGCWAPSTATVVSISTRSPSAVGQRSCETEETMRERGGRPMREQREASARAPRVGVRSAPGHRPPRRGGVSSGALTGLDGGGEQQGNGAEAEEHRGSSVQHKLRRGKRPCHRPSGERDPDSIEV